MTYVLTPPAASPLATSGTHGPLLALAGTPLWPEVLRLLAHVPQIATGVPPVPTAPPGMPEMPPPPPEMFAGKPPGGLLQPVRVPEWYGKLQPPPQPLAQPASQQAGEGFQQF